MTSFDYVEEGCFYVVLSQTGTLTSKWLKLITKDKYNHVSLSLDSAFKEMCSFARYYTFFPFWGGFVKESTDKGVLKKYIKTKILVLRIPATKQQIENVKNKINEMFLSKRKYRYDMFGVFLAGFGVKVNRKYRYYCSEFVRAIMVNYGIIDKDSLPEIVKPIDFVSLKNAEKIYEGVLEDYLNNLK